jgi:uncharacterized glyoxalase superfamily protein PhnB
MIDIEAIFPVMVVDDLKAVKQFYESVFGFIAVFYEPDFYLHLVYKKSGAQLGFLVSNHQSQPVFLHSVMAPGGFVISFEVKDAAVAYAEAQRMNVELVMKLKEEDWGQVHFMVEDPAGFRIDVVQHLESSKK